MTANGDKAIELLTSIDITLKTLLTEMRAGKPKAIASDEDLAGPYGDPILKAIPRDWTGDNFTGQRYSACPAPLLDLVAKMMDYFGEKAQRDGKLTNNGKPVAPFNFADAGRARAWAARKRNGWQPPAQEPAAFPSDGAPLTDDDIPFVWLLPVLLSFSASLVC